MAENYIVTKKARKNMVQARAGAITLPKVVGMAFGNGGVDNSGNVIKPLENQEMLVSELLRKEIDGFQFIDDTTCQYQCTLAEVELAGQYISELGLYDENGDMVCIKNFTAKGKDGDMEMTYTVDDVF